MQTTDSKIKLLVILGPTASGKSDLAIFLAKKFGGEVVSADSRQIYRGLDIGSGKITKREMRGIPHHMLDIASPKHMISVAQYRDQAQRAIEKIARKNRVPILCGGTGFYISALLDNLILPAVMPDQKLRKKLASLSCEQLFNMLKQKDPIRASTIDVRNSRRLIRALEVIHVQGHIPPLSYKKSVYNTLIIGIDPGMDMLAEKIRIRLQKRLRGGMVKEVQKLHDSGISWKRLDSLGLEYRFVARYLQQMLTRKEMEEKLRIAIRHYAKRQMTWFRRDSRIRWFPPENRTQIYSMVENFLLH